MEFEDPKHQELLNRLKPGCICKGIRRWKIEEAIAKGARSFREVSAATGIGNGSCRSRRCGRLVKQLLDDLKAQ